MLSPKENYLRALRHEKNEYVPVRLVDGVSCGFMDAIERGPLGGGYDGFGVRWVPAAAGGGQPIPAPGEFLLEDVTRWKKTVTIPDLNSVDWESKYENDMARLKIDRTTHYLEYGCGNGIFERLAALMGFEGALIAIATEPDAVNDLFSAITGYKIKYAEKAAKFYKPDSFTNFDDVASESNLFISPEVYRTLIKPHHKRLYDTCRNLGMIPIQHTCGKAESIVEDIIETGAAAWSSVQPTNDIAGILDKYGDRLSIEGGYNTNGAPGYETSPLNIIEAEVERCFKEYGGKKGYIFSGVLVRNSIDPAVTLNANKPLLEKARKLREAYVLVQRGAAH